MTKWLMSLASGPSVGDNNQLVYSWKFETDFSDFNAVTLQPLVAEPNDEFRFIYSDKFVTEFSALTLTVTGFNGKSPFVEDIDSVQGKRYSNGIWYPGNDHFYTVKTPGIYHFTVRLGDASVDPQMIVKPPCGAN